jgi:hypothetical protein
VAVKIRAAVAVKKCSVLKLRPYMRAGHNRRAWADGRLDVRFQTAINPVIRYIECPITLLKASRDLGTSLSKQGYVSHIEL